MLSRRERKVLDLVVEADVVALAVENRQVDMNAANVTAVLWQKGDPGHGHRREHGHRRLAVELQVVHIQGHRDGGRRLQN